MGVRTKSNFDSFVDGYIQSMGFTAYADHTGEVDYDDTLFDGSGDFDQNWSVWEEIKNVISIDDLQEIAEDCFGFYQVAEDAISRAVDCFSDPEGQAGHDFNLTRNGHGAGFWDGDWDDGDVMTEQSEIYGTFQMCGQWNEDRDELVAVYFHG